LPIGTALHARTLSLCESLSYRDWAGYWAVSSYEPHHEHEYNALRNACGLIDVTPLFKYRVQGKDATRLVDRVITRDARKLQVGQVYYTPWCDEHGHVVDDGTVTRIEEDAYRWTAAEPNLRWLKQNALGLDVTIEDLSERVAALALQGPTSAAVLREVSDVRVDSLKYFRATSGKIAGVAVDVSRTGYTGDLGYEIWIPWDDAVRVWDALVEAGRPHDLTPAGLLALDVCRIEAGLLLIEVDFRGSRAALISGQRYTPHEMGLGRLVQLDKASFVGQAALARERMSGAARQIVGLELDWPDVEGLYDRVGLAPQIPAAASRVAVPVRDGRGRQVGRATSTTWSPVLKKLIALATLERSQTWKGARVEVEWTVEAVRHHVGATVVETPFFNPKRKTATPPASRGQESAA
jgi:glycine cleavage system T protein (aminomethyltransferase)